MEKQIITFSANEQRLIKTGGIECYASNIVSYIEAHFDLGANWSGYDSVRAVWSNDNNMTAISTVLDSNGACVVPFEVLKTKGIVKVNLVGSISVSDVLTDRLTSFPCEAVKVTAKAKIEGSETQPITPSQFEQFVAAVISEVEKVTGMTAQAETLPAGSQATARYENGILYLGIPQGIQGERGETGADGNGIASVVYNADYSLTLVFDNGERFTTPPIRGERGPAGADGRDGTDGRDGADGVTPNLSIGTVETLEPTQDAYVTRRGTDDNPIFDFGIPKGDTGEVSQSELDEAVTDLKSAISELGKVTFEEKDGYIASYGTIESPTSNAEKNTNRISVKRGDVFDFSMRFNETRSMWAGYATYNESGAFIERVMIVANVSGNNIHHIFTIGSGIGSIAFTYRSFGSYSPTICKYSQIENAYSDASNSINAINISNLAKRVGDYPCELGSIYYGDNTDATNRCRTSGFISVSPDDAFKCDNPYLNYAITLYTESGVFISDTGWKSGEFTVSNSSAHFARVNMRKADNSVIATTEISDIANDVKFIRSDIWGAIDEINVESTKLASIVQTASDYDCELGTIYLGQNDVSTTRCRTSGFIQTFGCKIIVKGEYLCSVSLYDNDKNFILDSGWQKTEYVVNDAKVRYIRIVMRKKDSSEISNAEVSAIASTFTIIRKINDDCFTMPYELPAYFETEAEDCATKLKAYCAEKALAFGIVTDTHIYEAPIGQKWWHDTVANMAKVNSLYPLDSIIHLGDIINGSLPSDRSGLLLEEARDDINSILKPTFMLVGNHDPNLFYDNGSEPIEEGEMYALIERYNEIDTTARPSGKPYWYKDYEPLGIRVIYLSAHMGDGYDKSEQSWGYPQEEITWYSNIALDTDKQVLILSHMPFSQGYVSYVSTAPTNGDEMKSATDAFISGGGIVIGLINGHTHFDYVHNNGNFKEISLGAETNTNNTSDKTGTGIYGYAPETAIQYGRTFGTLTQDLWNILVVRPTSKTCKLIRFGAGSDVEWSY